MNRKWQIRVTKTSTVYVTIGFGDGDVLGFTFGWLSDSDNRNYTKDVGEVGFYISLFRAWFRISFQWNEFWHRDDFICTSLTKEKDK